MKEEQKLTGKQMQIDFPLTKGKSISSKQENKDTLIEALIKQTDEFAEEAVRKRKERESEKIKFIGGAEISIKEIKDFIVANVLPYYPLFPNENSFFKEMYRLNNWDDREPNEWIKPLQVPNWINEIIYGRFPKEVLPSLQILNPYLPGTCIRGYKNFQFLNEGGQQMVIVFRDQCVSLMEACSTWHEFRTKYREVYGVPYIYQQRLFEPVK